MRSDRAGVRPQPRRWADREARPQQEFHVGVRSVRHTRFAVHRPRELMHDAQVYRAYLKDAERLREERCIHPPRRPRSRAETRVPAVPAGTQSWQVRQRRPARSNAGGDPSLGGRARAARPEATCSSPTRASSTRTGTGISERSTSRSRRCTTAALTPCPRPRLDSVATTPARHVSTSTRGAGSGGGRRGSRGLGLSVSTNGRSGGRTPDPRLAEELLR